MYSILLGSLAFTLAFCTTGFATLFLDAYTTFGRVLDEREKVLSGTNSNDECSQDRLQRNSVVLPLDGGFATDWISWERFAGPAGSKAGERQMDVASQEFGVAHWNGRNTSTRLQTFQFAGSRSYTQPLRCLLCSDTHGLISSCGYSTM